MAVRCPVFFLLRLAGLALVSCTGFPCPLRQTDTDVIANCSHLELTSLPVSWNVDTTWIDVSHNNLTSLQDLATVHLPKAGQLDASYNSLQELDQRALSSLVALHCVDLSHNRLTVISDQAFVHLTALQSLTLNHNLLSPTLDGQVFLGLSHLRHLDLSDNQLHTLTNGTFSHLRLLSWLSVRSNHLAKLEADAMLGLDNLTVLDLAFNQLDMTSECFPPGVFAPLSSVRDLHLNDNDDSHDGQYPADLFNDLVSLRYLAPDTFHTAHFGRDFSALREIDTLDISSNCKIVRLTNDSFQGFQFSTLRVIILNACDYLIKIDSCVFCDLPNLKILQITKAHYLSTNTALRALYGLQGQNMTKIYFTQLANWWYMNVPYVIDKENAEHLSHICVSTFIWSDSKLRLITRDSLQLHTTLFCKCIEHVDLSSNALEGDFKVFLMALKTCHRLRTVELQNQRIYSIEDSTCVLSNTCTHIVTHMPLPSWKSTVFIPIPPELTKLNLAAIFKHFNPLPTYMTFQPGNILQTLDMSYNEMAHCLTTFTGLDHLVTLKLNFNNCYNVSHTIFDNLGSLRHLELYNFGARTPFYVSEGKRLFEPLTELRTLDLSFNELQRLDPAMLHTQPRLTALSLARNRFQTVPVDLGYHDNLTVLDLSHNILPSLTVAERDILDQLASRHDISVSLVGNPLTCTCANLDMVEWLWHTAVSLDGEGHKANYTCTAETGEITDTHRVMADMTSHWRRCVGPRMFGLALGLFLSQLLFTVVAYVIYRTWSHLCYAWKAIRRHGLPERVRDFPRDVYFVYADTDRDVMWACLTLPPLLRQHRPLRILLRNEEEVVGADKAESIAQHIETSWKTLLLVTRDFCQDEWACGFAAKQALRHTTDDTPDRVIVLFLEGPGVLRAMPSLRLLLRVVPERNVFHVQPHTPAHHPVWKAVADAIIGGQP